MLSVSGAAAETSQTRNMGSWTLHAIKHTRSSMPQKDDGKPLMSYMERGVQQGCRHGFAGCFRLCNAKYEWAYIKAAMPLDKKAASPGINLV